MNPKPILSNFIIILFSIMIMSSTLLAQSDTLVVYADGPSLDEIINNDVTNDGMQAHSVYKLVSLDTTYLYLAPITVKSDFTLIGVRGKDGRPPCIQPGLLADNSIPTNFVNMTGENTTGIFKDFYLLGLSIDGSFTGSKDFFISADGIKFYMDNVVVDENHYEVVAFNALKCSFFITNSKFRNSVHPTNWFGSSILAADYPSNNPADSIIMNNNTFLCVNSRAVTTGNDSYVNYFEFCHNSYVYNFTEDLRMFTVVNGKFNNNIFYSLYAGAQPVKQSPAWFQVFSPDINSLIDFDTLTVGMDSSFAPEFAGDANWRMLAEAKRNIEVKDNIYFWPKKLTDFWTQWNSTHSDGDSMFTPLWMNNRTQGMFDDDEHWPNLDESGNINVDPEFGQSVKDVIDNGGGTPDIVGLLQYVDEIRSGTASTNIWGYLPQVVSGDYWIPSWPLPEEATGALHYKAALTAPDGEPYGDPYWFKLSKTPDNLSVVSISKAYTASATPSANYPDPNGTKLTDGKFATSAYYADQAWVGFSSPGELEVVVDLGEGKEVSQFMAEYLLDPQPAINLPEQVKVSVSNDNSNFTDLGNMKDSSPDTTTSSIHKYYITLDNPIVTQYVKFTTVAPSGAWIFVDEYQLLGPVITDVEQSKGGNIPTEFGLSNNYPNPFNPSTKIKVSLNKPGNMTLNIYNSLGQLVKNIDKGFKQPGVFTYNIDMNNFSSGIYFYSLHQGSNIVTKKMILLK